MQSQKTEIEKLEYFWCLYRENVGIFMQIEFC